MNRISRNDAGSRRARRFPDWLREEWVWDGVLGVIVTLTVVYTVLSPHISQIV